VMITDDQRSLGEVIRHLSHECVLALATNTNGGEFPPCSGRVGTRN
jgi:hypothetical protein